MVTCNDFRDRVGQDDTFIIALKPEGGLKFEFFMTYRCGRGLMPLFLYVVFFMGLSFIHQIFVKLR